MFSLTRSLLIAGLILHSSLGLTAPKPEPVKSCPQQLMEWGVRHWKGLVAGAVVLAGSAYGVYELNKPPAATNLVIGGETQKDPDTFEGWQKKHAASSPVLAFNRKTEWKLERGLVEAVDAGKPTELSFTEPLWHNGKRLKEVELNDALDKTGVEDAAGRAYSEKDRKVVEGIAEYVKQSKPTELVLVHVASPYALDYYLRHPRQAVRYATSPWNGSHRTGNDAYEEYRKLAGAEPELPLVQRRGLTVYLESLLRLADYKKANRDFNLNACFEERPTNGNVLFLGSLYGSRDISVIEDLPTAEALQMAGFTSITILVDGLPVQPQPYTLDEASNAADFLKRLQNNPEGQAYLAKLRESRPTAYELVMSGKVQVNPAANALVAKARVWQPLLPTQIFSVGP